MAPAQAASGAQAKGKGEAAAKGKNKASAKTREPVTKSQPKAAANLTPKKRAALQKQLKGKMEMVRSTITPDDAVLPWSTVQHLREAWKLVVALGITEKEAPIELGISTKTYGRWQKLMESRYLQVCQMRLGSTAFFLLGRLTDFHLT